MRMQKIFFGQGMWMRTLLHRVNFFNQVSRDAGIRIFGPACSLQISAPVLFNFWLNFWY
jgi:hypothetical protein